MQLFSDRSETSSILPKLHFQAAGRPDQAGPNPSLVVVIVAILLLILLFAGDHDRRWKWHRSVQKLLAGATAAGRGRPSPFSTLIYFASLQFERILFPYYFYRKLRQESPLVQWSWSLGAEGRAWTCSGRRLTSLGAFSP